MLSQSAHIIAQNSREVPRHTLGPGNTVLSKRMKTEGRRKVGGREFMRGERGGEDNR